MLQTNKFSRIYLYNYSMQRYVQRGIPQLLKQSEVLSLLYIYRFTLISRGFPDLTRFRHLAFAYHSYIEAR